MEQQNKDGDWLTVAAWSKKLNTSQQNYSATDKEWLAVVESVSQSLEALASGEGIHDPHRSRSTHEKSSRRRARILHPDSCVGGRGWSPIHLKWNTSRGKKTWCRMR